MGRFLTRCYRYLMRKIRKPKTFDLDGLVNLTVTLCEDFENMEFYAQELKSSTKYTPDELVYMERAGFNLTSLRDELKIRNQKEKRRVRPIK